MYEHEQRIAADARNRRNIANEIEADPIVEHLTACALVISSSVCPSAAAFTTASVATLPPAPGRFSMMTGCPSRPDSQGPSKRARISDPPPAALPTSNRTGRVG